MQKKYLIDKDRVDFLLFAFFGVEKNPYATCSKKAYRDLCRTLRFKGESGQKYREKVDKLLEEKITEAISGMIQTQDQYDIWHKELCNDMIEFYKSDNIEFNIGHAQKWINMMMKYLYIQGVIDVTRVFNFSHVPVDQYLLEVVQNKLSIPRICDAWSKLDDYQVYLEYQKKIREKIQKNINEVPLRWEMCNWIEEVKRRAETSISF